MKNNKNKSTKTTFAVVLLVTLFVTFSTFPMISAHDPPMEIRTFAYVSASPNPIGVGQQVNILMWLDKVIFGTNIQNDIRFHDYSLTITKPDGTTDVLDFPVVTDTTSAQFTVYTPTQAGTYTLDFEYPGQTYSWSGDYQNDIYLPSSATTTLTVQEDPVPGPTSPPLPTEYWTRPIFGENTNWFVLGSNWLGSGSPEFKTENYAKSTYVPGAVGSRTSHIMWTKPLQAGGIVGGNPPSHVEGNTYFEGTAYLRRYTNPIIVAGKLYYTEPVGPYQTTAGPTICADLRTGEIIWSRTDVPVLSFAYIYDLQTVDYHGVWQPILIAAGGRGSPIPSGQLSGYAADTGDWMFNVTNVPSGLTALGPLGEYLVYVITNEGTETDPDYQLSQWNLANAGNVGAVMSNGAITGVVDGSDPSCYDWTVPISALNSMDSYSVLVAYADDIMLGYSGTLPGGGTVMTGRVTQTYDPYTYFAINLDESKGEVGSMLWSNTLEAPEGNMTVLAAGVDQETGVFVEEYRQTAQWVGYDLRTGDKIWGPTDSQLSIAPFDYYGSDFGGALNAQFAYGKLYSCGFSGIMFCYDATTGDLLWTYGNGGEGNSTAAGYNLAYGHYPTQIYAIGNEVVYTLTYEHTVNTPIYKGAKARAIDANDGTELWTTTCYGSAGSYAIADGYSNFMNGYDNQIYVVGKGPSETTVSIENDVVTLGRSVMIKGSVIDTAAGTQQAEQAARFPKGVPVAADDCMDEWMEYVYQQDVLPANFEGVEVLLTVIDSNNNCRDIGTTTTDSYGNFGFAFEPEIEGQYMVIASFSGSEAYYGSATTTYFNVDPAASASTPIDTEEPIDTETPVDTEEPAAAITTEVAIIAVVAIAAVIGVAAYWFLKRK